MYYIIILLSAFLICLVTNSFFKRFANHIKAIDNPGELSNHSYPIPRTGGIGIVIAFITVFGYSAFILEHTWIIKLVGLFLSIVIIFIVGLLDDTRNISPLLKFVGQLLASLILVGCGIFLQFTPFAITGNLLSVFYVLGNTNAMNLVDGMDG